MLLQHPSFCLVPGNRETLYSVLELETALSRLQSISPSASVAQSVIPSFHESGEDLVKYCALEACLGLLGHSESLPGRGFVELSKSTLDSISPVLHAKSFSLVLHIQHSIDTILAGDTMGSCSINKSQLVYALDIRGTTSQLLASSMSSFEQPNHPFTVKALRSEVFELMRLKERVNIGELNEEVVHDIIVRLNNWVSNKLKPLDDKVGLYFRNQHLKPLICPISGRPMTDAVYLRCGKTVTRPALQGLLSGEFPTAHCCCDELYDDIEHVLHTSPIVSELAVEHLSRALRPTEIVRYGDPPTLKYVIHKLDDQGKLDLLQTAIITDNDAAVSLLLEYDLDIEGLVEGKTPLMWAAQVGSVASISKLISRGANVHREDQSKKSVLFYAANRGTSESLDLLFELTTGISLHAVMDPKDKIPIEYQTTCARGLHLLWQGLRASKRADPMQYLQRAMELDPENHLYAEEMQEYLDEQEDYLKKRMYVRSLGESVRGFLMFPRRGWQSLRRVHDRRGSLGPGKIDIFH